jgi:hypothetical protein
VPGLITDGRTDGSRRVIETDDGQTMSAPLSGARLIYH